MVAPRTWGLTAITMVAFAANSLLCREALRHTAIDPASFTLIRVASGAAILALLVRLRHGAARGGNWGSALALAGYAVAFSFAYLSLSAGTGALLLFGAVQMTMIGRGLMAGERFRPLQTVGLLLAVGGLVVLLLPGVTAPEPVGAGLMVVAGVAWGIYSLRGRRESDALAANAGNFLRGVPLAALACLAVVTVGEPRIDGPGLAYALASGGVASGLGYALWYVAVRGLPATHAATVQLSVPVITALAGAALLGESLSLRLALASLAVLGGIALVVVRRR
ncbi:DMT family transporter [Paramagnetospirillum magneticum]|uniref:Permease of the drug/metabolite transporter superfamily n=1 Tax=Paramagnetospirillum magneticum (strain ATCC 700264 / AMB-1) TaxID=342108 RepID=Q2W3M9_PARM1|nr:DMT family transporter [Paramagnetospirillum magneticum]BAE51546.1 Permease of the drug/metabolite transporter superfamily [Paramagnetospirillum magneticum AMB-1]